jgi:hypothetical protein
MKIKVIQDTFYTFRKGDIPIKESVNNLASESLTHTSVDWN